MIGYHLGSPMSAGHLLPLVQPLVADRSAGARSIWSGAARWMSAGILGAVLGGIVERVCGSVKRGGRGSARRAGGGTPYRYSRNQFCLKGLSRTGRWPAPTLPTVRAARGTGSRLAGWFGKKFSTARLGGHVARGEPGARYRSGGCTGRRRMKQPAGRVVLLLLGGTIHA
jgi:hypothetical protein